MTITASTVATQRPSLNKLCASTSNLPVRHAPHLVNSIGGNRDATHTPLNYDSHSNDSEY
jgi:hypothetical protein